MQWVHLDLGSMVQPPRHYPSHQNHARNIFAYERNELRENGMHFESPPYDPKMEYAERYHVPERLPKGKGARGKMCSYKRDPWCPVSDFSPNNWQAHSERVHVPRGYRHPPHERSDAEAKCVEKGKTVTIESIREEASAMTKRCESMVADYLSERAARGENTWEAAQDSGGNGRRRVSDRMHGTAIPHAQPRARQNDQAAHMPTARQNDHYPSEPGWGTWPI